MKIKRILTFAFSALALLSHALSSYAQSYNDSDEPSTASWGIKAAFDVNLPGKWHGDAGSVKMYKKGYGVTVGAVYRYNFNSKFYLEPGASIFYDNYDTDITPLAADGSAEKEPSLYKVGVRVPVVGGFTFNVADFFNMSVFTGPELSYAFAGDIRSKQMDLFGKDGQQRRIDCAWKVGIGVPYQNVFISLDAAIGMTDLLKGGMTYRDNRLTLGISYFF